MCKWQPNGSTFRISDDHPGQFVQCSNKIAYCFDCPANLVFDNHQNVCVFRHDAKKPIKHLDCKFFKVYIHLQLRKKKYTKLFSITVIKLSTIADTMKEQ